MASTYKCIVRLGWIAAIGLSAVSRAEAKPLTFTEINLDWFGLNGDLHHQAGHETRVASIRRFLKSNELLADVMAFEEIVDVDLLQNGVLQGDYNCHSYERSDPKHQHVVICTTAAYRFEVADDADGYALEDVDVTGHLRPAVHGVVEAMDGTRLAHVFAVHLKAMPDSSDVRMEQVASLVDYLRGSELTDPVVVLGDFNTYDDDDAQMSRAFAKVGLAELAIPGDYTWASVDENFDPAKFDRVWMSRSLLAETSDASIKGPCNSDDDQAIGSYNQGVSDHCPTHFSLER